MVALFSEAERVFLRFTQRFAGSFELKLGAFIMDRIVRRKINAPKFIPISKTKKDFYKSKHILYIL